MIVPTPLIFAATCDLAGKIRGKAFPADQLEYRLQRGVGWTPTNVQINCFDGFADSPFGALGDLLLIPDRSAEVRVDFGEGRKTHFVLCDIVSLDGAPWDFCTRSLLKSALDRLHRVAGVQLIAAFEHEFQLKRSPVIPNQGYARDAFEMHQDLCELLMGAIDAVGLKADSIMKEYGPNQYEVVIGPEEGVRAADAAVMVRELTRSVARACGEEATFTPIRDVTNVGNGVHIHMSFVNSDGDPVTYDEASPCGMSNLTGSFAAGVLEHLNAITALTAPSVISYERLTPHRWSVAYNNLGFRDREASLRICPVTSKDPASIARQFNIEYRAADAAACPHLALAAIVHAGVQGIEDGLTAPAPTEEDLSLLSSETLAERGFLRLPKTLDEGLDWMNASCAVKSWFPEPFLPTYRAHKVSEIAHVAEKDTEARCAAYEATY